MMPYAPAPDAAISTCPVEALIIPPPVIVKVPPSVPVMVATGFTSLVQFVEEGKVNIALSAGFTVAITCAVKTPQEEVIVYTYVPEGSIEGLNNPVPEASAGDQTPPIFGVPPS